MVGPQTNLASTSNLATTTPTAANPYAAMDKGPAFQKGFGEGWTNATKGTPWGSTIGKAGITLNTMEAINEYNKKEKKPEEPEEDYYDGPYMATPRQRTDLAGRSPTDSSEAQYFTDVNPVPSYIKVSEYEQWKKDHGMAASGGLMALAKGGKGKGVPLENGAFIVDARTVSELGNGSSGAGQELLARYGGKALKGPGDGVSDSIRANIGGKQQARVARDEVKFSADAVKRLGGGSAARGTAKLYAMMDKAHAARKTAKRGQDTGLKSILR